MPGMVDSPSLHLVGGTCRCGDWPHCNWPGAAGVASSVYRAIAATGGRAADTPPRCPPATAGLRASYPDRPGIWVPFIHLVGAA
ncbi:hypothetical protein [Actinophytocola sp.]|uniref:hypothetical protein n=1 Tax=Actinophytocola sp. TaxID=1872138 RepID=UPI002ED17063